MGIPREIITKTPEGVKTKYLSQQERERIASRRFRASLEEAGVERRALRDFCFERLGLKKEDNRDINTQKAAALFLLSESRCPIDGLELVASDVPESTKEVCPRHFWQWGYYGNEIGTAVIQHPSPALISIEAGFLYPNAEGLSVIKELMQQ